jgi:hypothetical protein
MTYTVEIKKIQPAFNNAHRELWEKMNPEKKILRGRDSTFIQGTWWMQEHNVLVYGTSVTSWTHADFPSEQYLTYFLLKYN